MINYRYTEPGLISHEGYLFGIAAQTTWKTSSKQVGGILDLQMITGALNYNGSLCDVNSGVCTDYKAETKDIIFRLTHRFDFVISESFDLFIGPGVRYLVDKGSGTGFYTRSGTYFFAPLGFTMKAPISDGLLLFDFEYDVFLSGTMKSSLHEVNSTFGDVTHIQKNGSGVKVAVKFLGRHGLVSSIFYEHWYVNDSNVEPLIVNGSPSGNVFVEPKNFTDAVGIGLGFQF